METLRIIYTLVVIAAFLSICFWAYSKKSKQGFDDAAQLPLHCDNFDCAETKGEQK